MKSIIAIGHKQRRGKDTLASMIQRRMPHFRIFKISGAIKEAVAEDMGISTDELEMLKNADPSVRQRIIDHGQQTREKWGDDFWASQLIYENPSKSLIIPDLRLKVEANFISFYCNGGAGASFFINLTCTDEEASERGTLSCQDDPTETELDGWDGYDLTIKNNGSLEHLDAASELAVMDIKRKWGLVR